MIKNQMLKKIVFVFLIGLFASNLLYSQVPEGSPTTLPGGPPTPSTPTQLPNQLPDGIDLPQPTRQGEDEDRLGLNDVNQSEDEDDFRKREIGIGKGIGFILDSIGIFGHDYIRTNNFGFFENAADIQAEEDYILGPGDNISVSIWNYNDAKSDSFTISKAGFIEQGSYFRDGKQVSGLGRIYLAGVELGMARNMLRSEYAKIYAFDLEDFKVSLTASRNITVDIVGEVENPGSFTVPAINTVYNILKFSGGPTANGSVRRIQIKRAGEVKQILDVYSYLTRAENQQNIYLQENDVIFIPQIGNVIEIDGAVKRPTKYELLNEENYEELLYYAGGYQPNALKSTIQLSRFGIDEYFIKDYDFDLNNPDDFQGELLDGDLVKIKEIEAVANNIVIIEGAVNQGGAYEFKPGMKVSDLIDKANGLRFDAVTTRAYVTRFNDNLQAVNIPVILDDVIANPESDQNVTLFPKDQIEILSKADFTEEFSVYVFGQVRKPKKYLFGNNLSLRDLLIKAGGFKSDALTNEIELRRVVDYSEEEGRLIPIVSVVEKIKVDYNFLNPDQEDYELELRPYDQIFVRSIPEFEVPTTVKIQGEVAFPGAYPILRKDMRVSDLIKNSGGYTPFAYRDGARLYRKEDSTYTVVETVKLKNGETKTNEKTKSEKVDRLYVVDLVEIERRSSSEYNYVLKPNDRLVVPTIDRTISIGGAIRNSIDDTTLVNTAFRGEKSAKWYINEFGAGFEKDAWKRTTHVIYPNGKTSGTKKFIFFNLYPEVRPGSEVVVEYKIPKEEKKNSFFGDLTAEKTFALISSMVTTTALIIAVQNRR